MLLGQKKKKSGEGTKTTGGGNMGLGGKNHKKGNRIPRKTRLRPKSSQKEHKGLLVLRALRIILGIRNGGSIFWDSRKKSSG